MVDYENRLDKDSSVSVEEFQEFDEYVLQNYKNQVKKEKLKMKISETQEKVLEKLSKPHSSSVPQHPQDAFQERTLNALKKKGLVEFYDYNLFLHGAVRITEKGKELIKEA